MDEGKAGTERVSILGQGSRASVVYMFKSKEKLESVSFLKWGFGQISKVKHPSCTEFLERNLTPFLSQMLMITYILLGPLPWDRTQSEAPNAPMVPLPPKGIWQPPGGTVCTQAKIRPILLQRTVTSPLLLPPVGPNPLTLRLLYWELLNFHRVKFCLRVIHCDDKQERPGITLNAWKDEWDCYRDINCLSHIPLMPGKYRTLRLLLALLWFTKSQAVKMEPPWYTR